MKIIRQVKRLRDDKWNDKSMFPIVDSRPLSHCNSMKFNIFCGKKAFPFYEIYQFWSQTIFNYISNASIYDIVM